MNDSAATGESGVPSEAKASGLTVRLLRPAAPNHVDRTVVAWRVVSKTDGACKGGWIDGAPPPGAVEDLARNAADATIEYAFAARDATQVAPQLPVRDTSVQAEQQGLFRKFEVRRVDGTDRPGGKHHGCRYFVLDVDHDPCAHAALTAYAAACETTHPALAHDLRAKWGAAPCAQGAPDSEGVVSREQWIAQAARVYQIAGETESAARDAATALSKEQDWNPDSDSLEDPIEAAMADVEEWPSAVRRGEAAFRAVINYACGKGRHEEPLEFLRCWNEGNFAALRKEWPDAPPAIYYADPQADHAAIDAALCQPVSEAPHA